MTNTDILLKISSGSIRDLYFLFITLKEDFTDFDEIYKGVRYGFDVKFDIYDLWEESPNIVLKMKNEKVYIFGRTYPLEQFRSEKELRRLKMSKAIYEYYKEDLPYAPEDYGK